MTTTKPTTEARNWGEEITVIRTRLHCGKILKRKAGTKGGFQFHLKEESHYLHEGKLKLRAVKDGKVVERIVEAGEAWTVPPLYLHQEEALEDSVIFEVGDPTVNDRYAIEPDPGQLPSMSDSDAMVIAQTLRDNLRNQADMYDSMLQGIWLHGLSGYVPAWSH